MLINAIMGGDMTNAIISVLLMFPAILICLSVHEYSHGLAAYALGDKTAKNMGRLTLDPMAHIDKTGFLCMLLIGFGWAKPVPVNISNFKRKKLYSAIVALAGPLSNIILAMVFIALSVPASMVPDMFGEALKLLCMFVSQLSVSLAVFNLIPIYPLDGSRILESVLPLKYSMKMHKHQGIILFAFIAVLWFGLLDLITGVVYFNLVQIVASIFGLFF